jgi:hypothetical protein
MASGGASLSLASAWPIHYKRSSSGGHCHPLACCGERKTETSSTAKQVRRFNQTETQPKLRLSTILSASATPPTAAAFLPSPPAG